MKRSVFQVIKEEVQNFFSDWQMGDEPSIADKYYEKYHGIDAGDPNKEAKQVDAEVIGYVTTDWGRRKLETAIPIYKNPRSLEGIGKTARGILMQNGDFYVAKTYYGAHEIILEELAKKELFPKDWILIICMNYPMNLLLYREMKVPMYLYNQMLIDNSRRNINKFSIMLIGCIHISLNL